MRCDEWAVLGVMVALAAVPGSLCLVAMALVWAKRKRDVRSMGRGRGLPTCGMLEEES